MIWMLLLPSLLNAVDLPAGSAPAPVASPHFPDQVHAFVWRNWTLVPPDRMAQVLGTSADNVVALGRSMGLAGPPDISDQQWRRSFITIIRRNWHLLPYEQLLTLLDWTPEEMAFCLREDDFLYVKLGNLKPKCPPLAYTAPTDAVKAREAAIAAEVRAAFPDGMGVSAEPLFGFLNELSTPPANTPPPRESQFNPRYCYSYFALYGDPLMQPELDPYPDGYLAQLAASGVNGVWLQAVLFKLAPFPWDPALSENYEKRIENLKKLVERAKARGIGIYLYLNEPRSMPQAFFEKHPELKGVSEGDYAAMCSSVPEVQTYLRDGIASICRAVPDLAGFFTISASENLTNCWSHYQGAQCPHCKDRNGAEVVAEVNRLIYEGIQAAAAKTRLIAWDWGWQDAWIETAAAALPKDVAYMSVSEWSIPTNRGGIDTVIGEYSISTIGPGPRATKNWGIARAQGLKTLAKIQANNTWEISAAPYIPAVENVAQHAANLRGAGVDGLMMSWTLGGYPSPNLEVIAEMGSPSAPTPDEAMLHVATARFGEGIAPAVVQAWKGFSAAFREFPFSGGLYVTPVQMGPANPLWGEPTGYASTMVGLPYDHVEGWRGSFPIEVFIGQFTKMADGFNAALDGLDKAARATQLTDEQARMLAREENTAITCAIHFQSVANQCRIVTLRNTLAGVTDAAQAKPLIEELAKLIESERALAIRLFSIQSRDSRIGFEASNQYYYVPADLAEKVINCNDLLNRWIPALKEKFAKN